MKLNCVFSYGKENFDDPKMIRELVFVEEQGFQNEFDEIDERANHLVIYDQEKAIGTGRLFVKDESTMIIGRIAILKQYRGKSLGNLLVTVLENKAKELGYCQIELSAQQRAQGFYEKLGYQAVNEVYYDEYCPHITMIKLL